MSAGYFPTLTHNIFEDNFDEYSTVMFDGGIICGCTGKIYNKSTSFKVHCKSKKHQNWLLTLTTERYQIYNQSYKSNDKILNQDTAKQPDQKQDTEHIKSCVICFDELCNNKPRWSLPCAHTFHTVCINKWLKVKKECPVCKLKV